jgi:hypothetical protein
MRKERLPAPFASVFLCLVLAVKAGAHGRKKTSAKEDGLSGSVHMIDKDASSIIIRKGAIQRRVVYDAETKFKIRNKLGSIDDVIVGRQVICLGTFNNKRSYWLPVSRSGRDSENAKRIEYVGAAFATLRARQ